MIRISIDPIKEPIDRWRSLDLTASFRSSGRASAADTFRLIESILATTHSKTGFGNFVGSPKNAILMYHGVGQSPDVGYFDNISTERFEKDVRYISNWFETTELSNILDSTEIQQIAVTFDDGLRSFYSNAYPILQKYNVPATVFVTPTFVDDQNRDEILSSHYLTEDPGERIMMTADEIRELTRDPLITIGNHTLSHKKLSAIDDEDTLHREIIESKNILEKKYDIIVDSFCYPYGAFNEKSKKIVERSHNISVTTRPLLVDQEEYHALPRLSAHEPHPTLRWKLCPAGDRLSRLRYNPKLTETLSS